MKIRSFLTGLGLAVFLTAPAAALELGERVQNEAPVDIDANQLSYDRATETWNADGDVHLKKGDLTLLADSVHWNTATGEAEALGNVQLTGPEGVLEGDDLNLNLETGLGRLAGGRILVREPNYHVAGGEIERVGEQRFRILDGTFTTCDADPPAWKFTADRLDLSIGGFARARHVFFYIHDIPVLYTPFIAYPVKTERESGFLMPRIGSSSKRGFQLSLAWYQVIDRHLDATLYVDYLSNLGIGTGLEYRYILGTETEGTTRGYYLTGFGGEKDRWAVDWEHAGPLPGEVRLTADVEQVSSKDYFQDFGVLAEEYNRDQTQSVIAASRHWDLYSLTGQFKYIEDLEQDNDLTLQKLPEAVFVALPQRLGTSPFFLGMDSSYTHFWRREGMKGERLSARPELSAAIQPGDLLEIRSAFGYRERLYSTSDQGPGYEEEGIFDFSTRASSHFARIFTVDGKGVKKVRHSIEPVLGWSYIPAEDQEHLPQFDALDTIEARNNLSYALVNRFTARLEPAGGAPYYHQFLYLRLSQEYDIREARRDDLAPGEDRRPFTPLRLEAYARPTRLSFLDVDLQYDINSGVGDTGERLVSFRLRGGLRDEADNGISLNYYDQRDDDLNYLSGKLDLALLRPIYLSYLHRQDLKGDRVLEKVVTVEYRAQCWSVFLTLRDRTDETEFLISFGLTGLGKVADLGGRLAAADE